MKTDLTKIPTTAPSHMKKGPTKAKMKEMAKEIAHYQHLLYAEGRKSLLVIFQGMDASGKDGSTKNVFKYCNPSGINAHAFKKPSDEEMAHDFLWRVHQHTPAKGQIVIFNRSHYEDILIQRVHKWIDEDRVDARIRAINSFERLLVEDNDTTILKFYMHISPERQLEKLQERIDDPTKNWKHNPGDWKERKLWGEYMHCYQDAIDRCSYIPWIIAPVDSRWYRNYFVAKKVLETLKEMSITLPKISS